MADYYSEGYEAYEAGKTIDSCPYNKPTKADAKRKDRWLDGYEEAVWYYTKGQYEN